MSKIINNYGIKYTKPYVILLQDTGLGTSEYAARTAYDSFSSSENEVIKELNNETLNYIEQSSYNKTFKMPLNETEDSKLLDDLAWTYFHHSVLEHANLTFLIRDMSRGVLQELARHRIASYTVKSTRYTMSNLINTFVASQQIENENKRWPFFLNAVKDLNMFVTDSSYNNLEIGAIYDKLLFQYNELGKEAFNEIAVPKKAIDSLSKFTTGEECLEFLNSQKKKRNVGDAFKHLVTDNWKVDLVMTMNLRSLKNFFNLRDSGAAYFQIRWLAEEIKKATPEKYKNLIIKK